MNEALPEARAPALPLVLERREIGRIVGTVPGATLIVIGGVHGNEPGGVLAAQRVFARLATGHVPTRGEVVAFAGNVAALRADKRYLAKDLNRTWTEAAIAGVSSRAPDDDDPEDGEQRELLEAIEAAVARARGPVYLVDLHTTSAAGLPFVIFGDTLAQRAFGAVFPLPIVLGLEEQLDGALSQFWTRRGCVTLAVEGGQHADPASIDNLAAVVWIAAERAGVLARGAIPELGRARAQLDARRAGLPRLMEVITRHAIHEGDGFVMEPGFRNLDRASEGQLLARDRRGEIRAPRDGMIILPLYQGQGTDGYFWGREVGPVRKHVSEVLRRLRADRALAWLPGVAHDRGAEARLRLGWLAARLYPLEIFRFLGYRRVRTQEGQMIVERSQVS